MSSYWDDRSVQRMFETMELAEKKADELSETYLKSARYIILKIKDIFERFQKKHGLSEREARKLLEDLKDKTSVDNLLSLIRNSDTKNKEWIAELESVAYRARLERLFALQKEIDRIMMSIYNLEKASTTDFYKDVCKDSYYKGIFDIQQRLGFGFTFSHISEKQIRKVLSMKWSGLNYSERIWKNTRKLAEDLQTELLVNLLTGRTEREAAEIIMDEFAAGSSNARRLVRTESNFISSELNNMAYEEAGIEKYRYLATLDLKTSKLCRQLDGKVFLVKDRKVGVNCNPMHPWCRSTTVAEFDSEYIEGKKRRARDPKTGRSILVPQTMTYDEWYDKFVKGNPGSEEEEKKVKNLSADKKQYEEYKNILGDDIPDSFVKFQEMKYNDTEKWEYTKEYKKYMENYPDSEKRYFDIQYDLKKAGIRQGVALPPKRRQAYILPEGKKEPYHIMHRMLGRNISDDDVRGYMADAKCMFVQWGGQRQAFYGTEGIAVITKKDDDWIYKTAWKKCDFDESTDKILEVINKHVR